MDAVGCARNCRLSWLGISEHDSSANSSRLRW